MIIVTTITLIINNIIQFIYIHHKIDCKLPTELW